MSIFYSFGSSPPQVQLEEWPRVRSLYERLLQRTQHVKVWLSYARTEESIPDSGDRSRKIYQKANNILRSCEEKEQRIMLLEAWKDFEERVGSESSLERVENLMPRRVTKRKQVTASDGVTTRWEECIDYIFPDDEAAKPSLMLLAKAKEWMKKKQEAESMKTDEEPKLEADDNIQDSTSQPQTSSELTDKEKEQQRLIQNMFDDDNSEEAPSTFDPNLDKDDSDVEIGSTGSSSNSDSSDSEDEDDKAVSKEERVRKKMEIFRERQKASRKSMQTDENT